MNSDQPAPWVVIRCRNDAGWIGAVLAQVRRQTRPCRILLCDNASSDGSRELAEPVVDRILDVPEGAYVPGRVLNQAMALTEGPLTVFLNSDCEPVDDRWLAELLDGFADPEVAAVFGRQDPRPGCDPLFAKDTLETFGDGRRQKFWRHCFSMASSAIRREDWEARPFREDLSYSEDVEWTWAQRGRGRQIVYRPTAGVYHSHNYTLGQWYRRQFGEGRADRQIFDWSPAEASLLRYTLLPWMRQVATDWLTTLPRFQLGSALKSPVLRTAQALGRRAGFRAGTVQR